MNPETRRFLIAAGVLLALTLPAHSQNLSIISGGDGAPSAVNGSGVSSVGLTAPGFTATGANNPNGFTTSNGVPATVVGNVAATSAPAVRLGATGAFTASDIVVGLYKDNITTAIDDFFGDGSLRMRGGGIFFQGTGAPTNNASTLNYNNRCDTTGAPGNATCNAGAGRFAIAAAAATVTITDPQVTSGSATIVANLQTNDATCTSIKSIVPAAGSFVVTVNAACTGNTNAAFLVAN